MSTSKLLKLGEILVEKQFCTPEQVEYALKLQQDYQDKNIGTILFDLAYITKEQLEEALEHQKKQFVYFSEKPI